MTSATFPARLRKARAESGQSLRGLAEAAAVNKASLLFWEQGARTPQIDTVERLAKALGVEPAWLAYGCPQPVPADEIG